MSFQEIAGYKLETLVAMRTFGVLSGGATDGVSLVKPSRTLMSRAPCRQFRHGASFLRLPCLVRATVLVKHTKIKESCVDAVLDGMVSVTLSAASRPRMPVLVSSRR